MGEIVEALRRAEGEGEKSPPPARPPSELREPAPGGISLRSDSDKDRPIETPRTVLLNASQEVTRNNVARISLDAPHSPPGQEFRRIAFRLRDQALRAQARSVVVISAEPSDGKTTMACNLAIQLAQLDQSSRVALVDLDLHRASVASSLGVKIETGFDAAIRGEASLASVVVPTDVPGLWVAGLAAPVDHADLLLTHPNLAQTIRDLEQRFDLILIDTPPILAASDAQVILRCTDAALLVVRAGKTSVRMLTRALEHLPAEKLLGTLLNSSRRDPGLSRYAYTEYASSRVADSEDSERPQESAENRDEP